MDSSTAARQKHKEAQMAMHELAKREFLWIKVK
jgi:hypothetical protein